MATDEQTSVALSIFIGALRRLFDFVREHVNGFEGYVLIYAENERGDARPVLIMEGQTEEHFYERVREYEKNPKAELEFYADDDTEEQSVH